MTSTRSGYSSAVGLIELYVAAFLLVIALAGGGLALGLGSPFAGLLEEWRAEGIVSDEQARTLSERHAAALRVVRRSRIARVLGILGGVTIGVGAILFFAANWDEIPRAVRVAILIAFLVGFLSAGYWLRNVTGRYPSLGHAFLLIGTVLFGVSIFLVAQMYHWDITSPRPFLIWTVAALAVAVASRADLPAAVAAIAFSVWLIYSAAESADDDFAFFLVPVLLGLYGLALYGGATGARPWLERLAMGTALRFVGFAFTLVALIVFTFRDLGFAEPESPRGLMRAAVIAFAVAAAAGSALLFMRRTRATSVYEGIAVAVLTILLLLAAFAPEGAHERHFSSQLTWYPLIFTLAAAAVCIGAIVAGFLDDEAWLVSAATVFAAVLIVIRFVDESWPTLQRSFGFLLAGAVALGIGAALERERGRRAPAET
jgi:uncharacterized membrane protein